MLLDFLKQPYFIYKKSMLACYQVRQTTKDPFTFPGSFYILRPLLDFSALPFRKLNKY